MGIPKKPAAKLTAEASILYRTDQEKPFTENQVTDILRCRAEDWESSEVIKEKAILDSEVRGIIRIVGGGWFQQPT